MSQQTYESWIADFRAVYGEGEALCWYATEDLQRAFPELKRRYGVVTFAISENRVNHDRHVWCETPGGFVVDPTDRQFEVNWSGEAWEGILSRRVTDPRPEYHREFCPQCRLQTFDTEPLDSPLQFASMCSTKVGAFLYKGADQQPLPHLCSLPKEPPCQNIDGYVQSAV